MINGKLLSTIKLRSKTSPFTKQPVIAAFGLDLMELNQWSANPLENRCNAIRSLERIQAQDSFRNVKLR